MNFKNILITSTLLTSLNVVANDDINYTWLEFNFGWGDEAIFTLAGSFEISDNIYITADVSRFNRTGRTISPEIAVGNFNYIDNSYGFSLGFHKPVSKNTDLYSELGYRKLETEISRSLDGAEFTMGSRTIVSPKFEIITSLNYVDINEVTPHETLQVDNFKGGFTFGISGLYKVNKSSNVHFELMEENSSISPSIGYRFNW